MMHASHEAMLIRRVEKAEHRAELAQRRADALQYLLDELTTLTVAIPGLRPIENRIVGALLRRPGQIMTDAQIIAAYRADAPEADWPEPDTAKTHICNIRRKLGPESPITIKTHWGFGYSATVKED